MTTIATICSGIGARVEGPEYKELYRTGEPSGWVHMNGVEVPFEQTG